MRNFISSLLALFIILLLLAAISVHNGSRIKIAVPTPVPPDIWEQVDH